MTDEQWLSEPSELAHEDFEYEAYVPGYDVYAQVNKMGGGTPPRQYTGGWMITLREGGKSGKVLMSEEPFYVPLPATHARAAKVACTFLPEEA